VKKKYFIFHQDLYHQDFALLPGWTRAEVLEILDTDVSSASAGAAFIKNGVIYIWVKEFTHESLEFLVHECVHAANFLFFTRGQELTAKNDEAQAYLVQWIFAQCLACLKKKRKCAGK
jgi:hypothetical protein